MSARAGRAEQLLAVPTAANVWAALDEVQSAIREAEIPSAAQLSRIAALLNNALAIRIESHRLRSGVGSYAPDGQWEALAAPSRVAVEG